MSITQNTLIGKTRQSIGGVTFTTWKGRNVIKTKPLTVSNPQTLAQTAQRTKFSDCTKFFAANRAVLEPLISKVKKDVTNGNWFTANNINLFPLDPTRPAPNNPLDMKLSSGSLATIENFNVSVYNPTSIMASFSLVPNTSFYQVGDGVTFLIVDFTTGIIKTSYQHTSNGENTFLIDYVAIAGNYNVVLAVVESMSSNKTSNTFAALVV